MKYYICNNVLTLLIGAIVGMLVLGFCLWLKNPQNQDRMINWFRLIGTYAGRILKWVAIVIGAILAIWLIIVLASFLFGGGFHRLNGFGLVQKADSESSPRATVLSTGSVELDQSQHNIINQNHYYLMGNGEPIDLGTNRPTFNTPNINSTGLNGASTTGNNGWLPWPARMNSNMVCLDSPENMGHRKGVEIMLQPGQVIRVAIAPGTHPECATTDLWHLESWCGNKDVGQIYRPGLQFPSWMIANGPCEVRYTLKSGESARLIHIYQVPD